MTLHIDYIGTKRWFQDGLLHNPDGPALVFTDGHKSWFIKGQRHNAYGPAVVWPTGWKQWYLHGIEYTEKDYTQKVRKLMFKYFHIWYEKCDRPGTTIFKNGMHLELLK